MPPDRRNSGTQRGSIALPRGIADTLSNYADFNASQLSAVHALAFRKLARRFGRRSPFDMTTIVLLVLSNVFMTFAWYGHLKHKDAALWKAILASWMIAFFEYCLQVPANRIGSNDGYSAAQLKIMQEAITLVVFIVFAKLYFDKEPFHWNYAVGFALVFLAAFVVNHKW